MAQIIADNVDVACYYTTKHSWRGKYKRLFAVGTKGITTYNPNTLEITNQWSYKDFAGIIADTKSKNNNEYIISLRKPGKKNDTMRFSSEHRNDIITETLRYSNYFSENYHKATRFNARKHHWSDTNVPVVLEVGAGSLHQLGPNAGAILASYDYQNIEGFTEVTDFPGGVAVIYTFNRLHLFSCAQPTELIKACIDAALRNLGITIKKRKQPISFEQFVNYRFGDYSADEHITSLAEFQVQKITIRSTEPVRRILCLSDTCILERDPGTYAITTLRPLSEIFALVRSPENPQLFTIEYCRGQRRKYYSTERDSLLATLLDGVRASGNRDVCIKMKATDLGIRIGPQYVPVEEEVESMHLKFLAQPPTGNFTDAVYRFNSCVQYSGLLWSVKQDGFFTENKEKMINSALTAMIDRQGDQNTISDLELQAQFHAIRRLVASKAGFVAFTQLPKFRESLGVKVIKALQRDSDVVTHAAIDMIVTLLCPMHDNYDLRQEQLNKSSLLSSKKFLEALLQKFEERVLKGHGALVISAMLDLLTFSLCAPHSETTEGKCFDQLLQLVADMGRCLFRLFQHPSMAIVKGAGLVMKAIIEEGDPETAARMQELSLAEGALPRHLHTSMFTASVDTRMLTNRQLSQHLIGLWVTGHPPAMALLKRILPSGLLIYLESEDEVPENERDLLHIRDNLKSAIDQSKNDTKWKQLDRQLKQVERLVKKQANTLMVHWRDRMGLKQVDSNQQKPIVLRKRRQRIKSEANWALFYYQFNRDHSKPNLIWNHKTREELRDALENEMRAFQLDKDLGQTAEISWNYNEFELLYECLSDEIRIGDYYLRLLLEEEFEDSLYIKRPYEFFNDLYHRFLLTPKTAMKCMCLQAMSIVYGRYWEDIGPFHDTKYIVGMLERCSDRVERDRLVLFIEKLIKLKTNSKEILDANGVKVLVDLLSLAHLHITRAHVPTQRNVIEATSEMMSRAGEKEWYFGNQEKERLGPYSFQEMKDFWQDGTLTSKSRCWAQGMDGWRPLHLVTQLKWCLMASGQAVMHESELATTVLNILITVCREYPSREVGFRFLGRSNLTQCRLRLVAAAMFLQSCVAQALSRGDSSATVARFDVMRDANDAIIRPLPRIRRFLGEPLCFPHCVQLLLTFDPILVEKASILAFHVMEDNPVLSRAYLSGVFFFILMYTGSNILPIVKFLQYLHLKQAFRSEQHTSDILSRSILGAIFPEAMIHYLENYGAEKFSEIFLGEFDTPEAIWSNEMRRYMIEKIAVHIADFSPRLTSNIRALYQYVPIPAISYPQLEDELFCNIYYLRHLCDETRFPDWPIKKPVEFLKDVLETWKKEVEKKAPKMSYEEAYDVLKLPKGKAPFKESIIRKAYFRMAQKYHPDKNPEGRDIFESVNKAYEFLCSKKKRVVDGPDPKNVLLLLKTQSILFKRHKTELAPYKYAGYPALIKTIVMEKDDAQLFSKPEPLLAEATELAYHTMNCSNLNAEELRREEGIEILQASFARCVSMLTQSSKPDDLAVRVCMHVVRCYAVSAQFEECREKFMTDYNIIQDICRMLYYKDLPQLCIVTAECVSAFAVDMALQTQLFKAGVVWHLLLFLFNYDFTLEEGGVEKSEKSNQQEVSNRLARLSISALACLGGYMTPDNINPMIHKSIAALITPFLSKQLKLGRYDEVLKTLNSNTENPYLMWDNGTRFELVNYLKEQQQKTITTGECDPSFGAEFVFSLHSKELIVGDIFVRIYNEQPTFPLEDAQYFAQKLIDYLGSQAETSTPTPKISSKNMKNCLGALKALANVMKNNNGTEVVCIGHFKLLFSLLRVENAADMQLMSLEVLSSVTSNKMCVENIADSSVAILLLLTLDTLPSGAALVIEILHALASNGKIVKQLLSQGGLLYLLNLFCNSLNPDVRQQTAELFAKLAADKLNGPKVRIFLLKFLPVIFMDAMRDSPEASVHMFEGTHENPELIWNEDSRKTVSRTVKKYASSLRQKHVENPEITWSLPKDFEEVYADSETSEIVVGGVYLRLFVAQPGWVLRNPREFTVEIMNRLSKLVTTNSPNGEELEMVTQAACCLFSAQPMLAEQLPSLGHLPIIFKGMMTKNDAIHKSCISLLHVISSNESCIHNFATIDCIAPLMNAMKSRPDQIDRACESLHNIFSKDQSSQIMQQVMKAGLIAYLLKLLEGDSLRAVKNAPSVKAQIVKALKAMMRSLEYGEQVQQQLDASSVWSAYKDQMHDLFISETPIAGYLTGGPTVAGYLTAAPERSMPQAPPPVAD